MFKLLFLLKDLVLKLFIFYIFLVSLARAELRCVAAVDSFFLLFSALVSVEQK